VTRPDVAPPRCRNCAEILAPPGHVCAKCGTAQQLVHMAPPQPLVVLGAQKSVGVAVVLSLVWFGAGQLYVGRRVGLAIGLIVWDLIIAFFNFTLVGAIIGIPLWLITAPFAAWLAASDAKAYNEDLMRR